MIQEQALGGPEVASWMRIDAVRDGGALASLRGEWGALLERSSAGIFNSWEWLYPWYRRIAPERELLVLTARDREGRLLGLLPLCAERRVALGRAVRRLSFLGETHVGADYLDVLAERGREEEVACAFAAALRERRGEWDLLDLEDLDASSKTVEIFRAALGRELSVQVRERYTCPFEPLVQGEQFDAFLRRTGRRDNYLRRRKWLERQPGYRIEREGRPEALCAPLAEFFRLHALRWAGDGGSQGIKGAGVEAFHRDATQFLAERGKLRLYTMRAGGAAVASVYALVDRGKFIYFQSGYDPAWRSKSVGLVLVGETFQDALQEGLREYDFLRGTEAYKSDWTSRTRTTVGLRAFPPSGPGALLERAERGASELRALAKWALPAGLVERIRRARRKRAAV